MGLPLDGHHVVGVGERMCHVAVVSVSAPYHNHRHVAGPLVSRHDTDYSYHACYCVAPGIASVTVSVGRVCRLIVGHLACL
jgi:hypothetical protein